jgi:hypothetical protein
MRAAFQYNLKRRPFFLGPYSLLVTESEPKTHNKRPKGDTFRFAPGALWASVQGLLSYAQLPKLLIVSTIAAATSSSTGEIPQSK